MIGILAIISAAVLVRVIVEIIVDIQEQRMAHRAEVFQDACDRVAKIDKETV